MKNNKLSISIVVIVFALGWVAGALTYYAYQKKNEQQTTPKVTEHPPKTPVNLSYLFSSPKEEEIAKVQEDWANRETKVDGWRVEKKDKVNGFQVWVVSHLVYGQRHYGLVRFPTGFQDGGKFPLIVYNHAGNSGATIVALSVLDKQLLPTSCLAEEAFFALPSYRGETLNAGELGVYSSEGKQSILDGDVDDALSLLNGVLANIPEVDEEKLMTLGVSRGGGVSLLMSVRDARIKALVEVAAETDLILPSIQEQIERSVDDQIHPINPVLTKVMQVVRSYLFSKIPLEDARLELIRGSAVYFAVKLPSLQIHHGAKDTIIPLEHSQRLYHALQAIEHGDTTEQELFIYDNGDHNILSLGGSGERIERFLCK